MPAPPPLAAVVFDLDGTLVDSSADLAAAINAMRRGRGLAPLPLPAVVERVGHGSRQLVRACLPPEVEGEAFAAAYRDFLARYLERCTEHTRPYPGIPELLAHLAGRLPLALLTNKPQRHTRAVLEGLGLAAFFRASLGGDSLPTRKPDPAGLRALAAELGADPTSTLLVGDSAVDAATAAAAPSPFAWVRWGYGRGEEVDGLPRVAEAGTVAELARWLEHALSRL